MTLPVTVEHSATRRLDRTLAAAVGFSRAFALAQTIAVARSIHGKVRRPRVLAGGVAALAAQTVWATQRGLRRGSVRDRPLAIGDAITQCSVLVLEAATWGTRGIPGDARWSETFGTAMASWTGFEDSSAPTTAASLLGWLGTYAFVTGGSAAGRGSAGQRVGEATGHATLTVAMRGLGRQLVAQATELDAARTGAVEQAQRLEAERERHRQYRIVHDSALQLLEAIDGGWQLDDELVQQRIDYEITRLRHLLDVAPADPAGPTGPVDLAAGLSALVEQFVATGLAVDLEIVELPEVVPAAATHALVAATREALTNVDKHADARRTSVRVTTTAAALRVRIVDDGRGFDPAQPHPGFGLRESIRGRMLDVGGTATVASDAATGTAIELRVPR